MDGHDEQSGIWRSNLRLARRNKRNTAVQNQPGKSSVLSIIIPTMPGRENCFVPLVAELNRQIESSGKDVEIVALLDNRRMTTGEKRNHMLAIAHGQFIASIDDDDWISYDYVAELVAAIESYPTVDVITFLQSRCKPAGEIVRVFHLGIENVTLRQSPPHHLMAWRADLAKQVPFSLVCMRDDWDWTVAINKLAKTEHHIDKVLYHYRIGFGGGW